MPASKPQRPRTRDQAVVGHAGTPDGAERAVDELARVLDTVASAPRSVVVGDLAIGVNRIVHGLGRKPRGATVTPTVVDAAFAWAMTAADERTATITTVGVAQPGAGVEFY